MTTETISLKGVRGGDLAALWTSLEGKGWKEHAHTRIDKVRKAMNGDPLFALPEDWDIEGSEGIYVTLAQRISDPLKMVNLMERRPPRLRRNAMNPSPTAESISTNIETWINAVCDYLITHGKIWSQLVGKLFLEGACAVVAVPSPAHWEKAPDWLDTLDEKRFKALTPAKKSNYSKSDDGRYRRLDEDGKPVPKSRYFRDAQGRSQDDEYYTKNDKPFVEDRSKTRKAYEEEQAHYLARRLPFQARVISPTDAIPIFGAGETLQGIVIRSKYTREQLLERRYVWEDNGLLTPSKRDSEVTLYEYWGYDEEGTPFAVYSVEGCKTSMQDADGQKVDAIIDLHEEWGMTRLPANWFWGLHLETDEYPKKGIPYLWPVLTPIAMTEFFLTTKAIHARNHAFTSWGIEADAGLAASHPEMLMENGAPREVHIRPMVATIYPGKVHAMVPPAVGNDVNDIIKILMQSSHSMTPADSVFGGQGSQSGFDRSLSREYLETSMAQVLNGALSAWQFLGETILEAAVGLTERTGIMVPVYAAAYVPQTGVPGSKLGGRKKVVELDPDWVGPIYNLDAYYPKEPGQAMAVVQQMAQLFKDGMLTWRAFSEKAMGDEAPEATQIEIWIDQQLRTDAGRQVIADLAQQMVEGDVDGEKQRLIERGVLTPNGTPVSMLAPGNPQSGLPDAATILHHTQNLAARRIAAQNISGAGPFGPTQSPIPPMAPAVPPNIHIPPGVPQAAGPAPGPGAPGQTLLGMGVPNVPNSALGGQIAGEMMTAGLNRAQGAAANQGVGR